ncbi:MAG TPA: ubiquitin-like small modifier protein 1 [Aggregatilineales bacterium]|jgi:molybdopterin synthase sulfur carrier subunit|nr:ubiquitin-like small modifier protein 1 [Aggregatilineales bacterium]
MLKITLYATLREIAGGKTLHIPFEGGTVRDFVAALAAEHPAIAEKLVDGAGQLTGEVHVFVQGRNVVWLDGLDTVIADGDEIDLIPPVAGG